MFYFNPGCGSSRIFLLPLPASFFKVLSLSLPQKFIRFRFHIPAPCFMKNAFASGSSKRQLLPSLLPLLQSASASTKI